MPPARTGVADYAAALLRELRKHAGDKPLPINLYHLGNNALHAEIYRRALERPGVAVLHDAVLNHFLLGQLGESQYIEEFVYNYGEWNRELARELWRGRAASGADSRYFEYPMLARIARASRAVVVHNPAAAAIVKRHAPEARTVEIPHLFVPPPLPSLAETLRFRQRMGVGSGTFLFGVFGFLRESKRLETVLDVFGRLAGASPHPAGLLVAGEFVSAGLERAVAPMLKRPGILRLPYQEERDFWLAASAVDACINLRYPAAGETSGISIRLMGIGKPVLVTDSPEYARVPEGACVRIAPGPAERESLLAHLLLLTSKSEISCAIGRRGAAHILEHHRVDRIGKKFWDLLCEFSS